MAMLFGNGGPGHRTLCFGDCLDWVSQWDGGTVGLILLHRPFDDRRPHLPTMTDPYTSKPLRQRELFA